LLFQLEKRKKTYFAIKKKTSRMIFGASKYGPGSGQGGFTAKTPTP
jgi:hypothetical protein